MLNNRTKASPSPLKRKRGHNAYKSGLSAEACVAEYFTRQGYDLLAQRYRTPCGEIDLLIANEDWLIAIEVKQRTTLTAARYALTPRQSQRLLRAFHVTIETKPHWQRSNMRLDVVIVDMAGQIEHIEDALRLY